MDETAGQKLENSQFVSMSDIPRNRAVLLQHHQLQYNSYDYHFHPSIEINYVKNGDLHYSFSGEEIFVRRNRFCVFWAAHPHRVSKVKGKGTITNAYVSLPEFLSWPLPTVFVNSILNGAVVQSQSRWISDDDLTTRWAGEVENGESYWQRLHILEIQSRLHRMALNGWDILLENKAYTPKNLISGNAIVQFGRMLEYIANFYSNPIKISDVAQEGGVSVNTAILLFRKMLGCTVKEHITEIRVSHAKMLLTDTDLKILTIAMDSGFNSLSAFYVAFQKKTKLSPAAFRKNYGRMHTD